VQESNGGGNLARPQHRPRKILRAVRSKLTVLQIVTYFYEIIALF
jgi:hypothetical protein